MSEATQLFQVSRATIHRWLSQYCLAGLEKRALLIIDNAPIHPKGAIQAVVKAAGYEVLLS